MHILTSIKDIERRMEELDKEITSIETQVVTNVESMFNPLDTLNVGHDLRFN